MEWIEAQSDIEFVGRLADIKPLLEQADLFLFPSYYREGVPRVIMEAAATGLPTVAFDVPGVREAVRDGETGFLTKSCDLDALVERVAQLIDNPDLRDAMAASARQFAEASFDVRKIQDRYLQLYRSFDLDI